MRDLAKDLETCRAASPGPWAVKPNYGLLKSEICTDKKAVATVWTKRQAVTPDGKNIIIADETGEANAQFVAAAREGWPHAIGRAIKAEAEVERLRLMVKSITGGLDEAIETVHFLEAEVERLRKIIGDAREWMLPNTEAWKITCELDKEGGE